MARIWASNTQNKIDLTEQQKSDGFIYQSEVKSDFFNGAVNALSQQKAKTINFDPKLPAKKGDIVRVIENHQSKSHYIQYRVKWNYYICLRDTNKPPIKDAKVYNNNGVFEGGIQYYETLQIHPDWQKITKLVQAPNVAIKYRPRDNAELKTSLQQCRSVGEIDTSRVTVFDDALANNNYSYKNIEKIAYWNTTWGRSFYALLKNSISLTSLDLSKWDTAGGIYINDMFFRCFSLTSLDLSHLDTSRAKGFDGLVYECTNLTSLDLSKWDTVEGEIFSAMFYGCLNLTTIGNCSGWNVDNAIRWDNFYANTKIPSNEVPQKFR